jgi:Transcriptional regulator
LRAEAAVSATGAQARGVVKLSIGATFASHWLMPRLGEFLRAHDHIQIEIITHPFPASVRRREADVVLRPVDSGEENLIGRRIGRLGTGFYASRDYAARRRLPERRDEWKGHSVIGFADRASNERLARWSESSPGRDRSCCVVRRRAICLLRHGLASGFPRCPALSPPPILIWCGSRLRSWGACLTSGCWRIRTLSPSRRARGSRLRG